MKTAPIFLLGAAAASAQLCSVQPSHEFSLDDTDTKFPFIQSLSVASDGTLFTEQHNGLRRGERFFSNESVIDGYSELDAFLFAANDQGNVMAVILKEEDLPHAADCAACNHVIRVYELSGSSPKVQRGNALVVDVARPKNMVLNGDGTILVVLSTSGYRAFQYDGALWKQMGNDIEMERPKGTSCAISKTSMRLAYSTKEKAGESPYSVRVTAWNGLSWEEEAAVRTETGNNSFGSIFAFSGDGTVLAVGAPANTTVGGESGAIQVFQKDATDGRWLKQGEINAIPGSQKFGVSLAISDNGGLVAAGTENNGAFLFRFVDGEWTRAGSLDDAKLGFKVALNGEGTILAASPGRGSSVTTNNVVCQGESAIPESTSASGHPPLNTGNTAEVVPTPSNGGDSSVSTQNASEPAPSTAGSSAVITSSSSTGEDSAGSPPSTPVTPSSSSGAAGSGSAPSDTGSNTGAFPSLSGGGASGSPASPSNEAPGSGSTLPNTGSGTSVLPPSSGGDASGSPASPSNEASGSGSTSPNTGSGTSVVPPSSGGGASSSSTGKDGSVSTPPSNGGSASAQTASTPTPSGSSSSSKGDFWAESPSSGSSNASPSSSRGFLAFLFVALFATVVALVARKKHRAGQQPSRQHSSTSPVVPEVV